MPIAILLYDSIVFVFRYHYIFLIKVNYSPCLVYLHQIMDKLFSPLSFNAYLCLPLTILAAYAASPFQGCTSVVVPYCSCCLCLYFGSSIMLVTYFVNFR